MEKAQSYFLVEGRVQGVGFRVYTQRAAQDLALSGWVRNLRDGRVEGVVFGEPERVEKFFAIVRRGPERSLVNGIHIEKIAISFDDKEEGRFLIQATGETQWLKP